MFGACRQFGESATNIVPYEDIDGLTHATPAYYQVIKDILQAVTFQPPAPSPITFEMSPAVGLGGGWDTLEKLGADGYVVMLLKPAPGAPPPKVLVSKSPLVVADAAKTGGTHVILLGSSLVTNLAVAALKVESAPSSKWFVPALVGVGVLGAILLIRR